MANQELEVEHLHGSVITTSYTSTCIVHSGLIDAKFVNLLDRLLIIVRRARVKCVADPTAQACPDSDRAPPLMCLPRVIACDSISPPCGQTGSDHELEVETKATTCIVD